MNKSLKRIQKVRIVQHCTSCHSQSKPWLPLSESQLPWLITFHNVQCCTCALCSVIIERWVGGKNESEETAVSSENNNQSVEIVIKEKVCLCINCSNQFWFCYCVHWMLIHITYQSTDLTKIFLIKKEKHVISVSVEYVISNVNSVYSEMCVYMGHLFNIIQ